MKNVTRRSVLLTGTATLVALGGCGNDGTSNGGTETSPQPTTQRQPTSLAIENQVLCAERPAGYRQFTRQPEATYHPEDVVWLYFEPSATGTEPAGAGEIRFEYDLQITVSKSDGTTVGTVEDTASKTIPDGSDISQVFLVASFSPPTEFDPGSHTFEVAVTDTIAGTTASTAVEFTVDAGLERTAGEFGFGRFAFLEEQAEEYRDYVENSDAEYDPMAVVWYYYEIDGFAYESTSDAVRHDLQLEETLRGPEGDVWSESSIPLSTTFEPDTDLDTYWVTDSIRPSDEWIPGEYELRFVLTDGLREETVTETYQFTVVS